MENVPQAPEPAIAGYGIRSFLLDNSALDGGDGYGLEQRRVRRFSFGLRGREAPCLLRWIDMAVFLLPDAVVSSDQPDEDEKRRGSTKMRRQAVVSDPSAVPVKIGGSGKVKKTYRHECINGSHGKPPSARDKARSGDGTGPDGGPSVRMGRYRLADALRLQGLPEDFLDDAPFTAEGKLKAAANGVPISMGRAIAKAVREVAQ